MTYSPSEHSRDVRLEEYLLVIWRSRVLIVVMTAVAALAALAGSLLSPRSFAATVTLAAMQAGTADSAIPMSAALVILRSESIAAKVVEELKLDAPPHRITPKRFLGSYLHIDNPPGTNYLQVRVTLSDRVVAAQAANRFAAEAANLGDEAAKKQAEAAQAALREKVDRARARRDKFARELVGYKQSGQVDVLRHDVDTLFERRRRQGESSPDLSLKEKLGQLYEREMELSGLEQEHDVAAKLYDELLAEYGRMSVVNRGPVTLTVIDPAVGMEMPRGPRIQLNVALAALFGFVAALALGFVRDFFVRRRGCA